MAPKIDATSGARNEGKAQNHILMDYSEQKPTWRSYIAIYLGLGWIITLILVVFSLPVLYYYQQWSLFSILVGLYMLSILYPVRRSLQPSLGIRLGEWMVRQSGPYFSFKIECADYEALTKAGPAIFCSEPHGVFPVTMFWGTLNLIPGQKMLCCLSNTMYRIPLMKHFLTWAGSTSIDRENINWHLNKGFSVQLCPGGLQEIAYWGDETEYVLFLKSRLGIAKLALRNGVPLVPSFTFGLRNTYTEYIPKNEFVLWCGRKIGFFPMIFLGLGGIPWGQPKPAPLTTVVGAPILVPKIPNPTIEEVKKYHALFLAGMEKLYMDNREANGAGHIPLRII